MIENINWYPGHMKKTRELIQENLKLVDLVIEVIDARIPISSRNPNIDELVKDKKRQVGSAFCGRGQFDPCYELHERRRCKPAF